MKKILYSMMAVLALSCTFVACGSDGDDTPTYTTTAEKASAGTYSGIFTRTDVDGKAESFDGTITLTPTDSVGCTDVTFLCTDASLDKTAVANVANAGQGFKFVNNQASNGLGAKFSGQISGTGVLTAAFTINQRVGRSTTTFFYTFEGARGASGSAQ